MTLEGRLIDEAATGPPVDEASRTAPDWVDANQRYLSAALDVVRRRLSGEDPSAEEHRCDDLRSRMQDPPALDRVAEAFGLSGFERDVLLLCAGVELDGSVAALCAAGTGSGPHVTFGLAIAAFPDAHWSAATPMAPLRRWHLVEVDRPDAPMGGPVRIDERVLHALTGISYLDPRLQVLQEPLAAPPELPPALVDAARRLAARWSTGRSQVHLSGRRPEELRSVVSEASLGLGLVPVWLRAIDLPTAPADRDLLVRLCERETVLSGRSWLVEIDAESDAESRAAVDFVRHLQAPVCLVGRVPAGEAHPGLSPIEVPPSDMAERRLAWGAVLGPFATSLDGWAERLAGQFDLGTTGITAAAEEVLDEFDDELGPRLWDACRRRARPALDSMAERLDPRATWADLVLPDDEVRLLREVALHVRHRLTVFEDWGFAARSSRGTGAAALFAGPSGTGKTLAAEVVAAELSLDLYRVDLSQVVSKYIGETEKNLRRIFDAAEAGGAILLFDEADALFGKRSEVKDSHDRYANIEVSYLLQRMETYRGLAVLTTNLKSALDPAFLRRLRFVVQFPFPDAVARADIWRRMFPPGVPTDGLDPAELARLTVTGGTIRNIALSAAFLAAAGGGPVRMSQVLAAARTEYAKLERPFIEAEVAGWATEDPDDGAWAAAPGGARP